jgi:hypothetical protein
VRKNDQKYGRRGIFERIFVALAGLEDQPDQLMIDASYLKAHRTAASLAQKGGGQKLKGRIGRTKGGLTSKL